LLHLSNRGLFVWFQYLAVRLIKYMKYSKWIGLAGACLLVFAAFLPWITIESHHIVVSGVDATGTNYGKPAYVHFVLIPFFIAFTLLPKIWAKRWNLIVIALNTAWVIRNYLVIGTCKAGECPVRETGFYLMLLGAAMMLYAGLFPDVKIKTDSTV
jgi:hypothetical protein